MQSLIENGVQRASVNADSYGECRPAASNAEEQGRAENRRIELVLQPNLVSLPDLRTLKRAVSRR
jgi:chemotaxis protein MotB